MLERHLFIPASPRQVWVTLTDPPALSTWFGAQVDWDLNPGGAARFFEDGGAVREGRIDEVVPDQHLRFRWWPEGHADDRASEVTYRLEPHEEGTDLTITERQLPANRSAQARARSGPALSAQVPSTGGRNLSTATWTRWDSRLVGVWSRASASVTIGTR